MRWGVICPSTDRGLGIQGWELARNLAPDKVLVVDAIPARWPVHPERFPGATVMRTRDGSLPEPALRDWLDGLDAIVFAETPYHWPICELARRQGCATVCWVNPEFHRDRGGRPSIYWAPSSWRLEHLPVGTRLVSVPVPTDRWPNRPKPDVIGRPLRWLHVGGTKALADRNGAAVALQAARRATEPATFTMRSQDRLPPIRNQGAVRIDRPCGTLPDYWQLYESHDVLVMPRRWGGLCLPAIEAAGAGLAVVMTDTSPNRDWPIELLPARAGRKIVVPAGTLPTFDADPSFLAGLMDEWARDPGLVVEARRRAQEWAQTHSWAKLGPMIRAELERAADRP